MKHFITLPFFLLATIYASGQSATPPLASPNANKLKDTLMCRDSRFQRISSCIDVIYFDVRKIDNIDTEMVFHKKSGLPFTGECIACHENGNLEMFLKYKKGLSIGIDTIYYPNGSVNLIRSHDTLGNGWEEGTWILYYKNAGIKWEKNFQDGMKEGVHNYYFQDSTLKIKETWHLNRLEGLKQEFYRDGTVKKEIIYKNGVWDGAYKTYFENGDMESIQPYKNGIKEGESTYYYDNGQLFYTEYHSRGLREGTFERFYDDSSKLMTVENYRKDQRHGLFEEYYNDEKNTLKYEANFENGYLLNEKFYDEFGELTKEETYPSAKEQEKMSRTQRQSESEEQTEGSGNEKREKKKKRKNSNP